MSDKKNKLIAYLGIPALIYVAMEVFYILSNVEYARIPWIPGFIFCLIILFAIFYLINGFIGNTYYTTVIVSIFIFILLMLHLPLPVVISFLPTRESCSIIATLILRSRSFILTAAHIPAAPPPTITTSYFCVIICPSILNINIYFLKFYHTFTIFSRLMQQKRLSVKERRFCCKGLFTLLILLFKQLSRQFKLYFRRKLFIKFLTLGVIHKITVWRLVNTVNTVKVTAF